jgi:cytoskeletal protein CcmA (bactofilin family)
MRIRRIRIRGGTIEEALMLFSGREKRVKQQPAISTKAVVEIETVLGPNTSIQGDIRSGGGVRIDGDFGGTIDIAGNLVIGEEAKVVATITAHNVQVQGTVQGSITAKRLEILDTGKLWGDIEVDSFVLDDGGFYRGQSKMQGDMDPPLLEAGTSPILMGRDARETLDGVVDVEATVTDSGRRAGHSSEPEEADPDP